MSERRVVVTGLGVVSPVGSDIETFWKSLTEGRSGVQRYTAFDSEIYDCKIAGEVRDFEPAKHFKSPKDARRTDRFTQLAMAAAKSALADSGIDLDSVDRERFGVMIGSGIGGLKSMEDECRRLFERGPSRVSPFTIAMMISNMASGLVSMEYDLRGPNMSIVTACATANHSIGEAWRMIKFDDADFFIAGGTEATITQLGMSGFAAMRALSLRNDEPEKASRPFDKDRDGFVMGEGAGLVILEELEHAKKRGAHIYCELAGYGLSADAYHMTQPLPEGEGAARCMKSAMRHAKINPEQIDYINAHGTSTPIGDLCETKAIKLALGDHAKKTMVSSTKSMTGHLLGAAGGVEFAACALAIKHGIIPPTINLDEPDPECDLDYVPKIAREKKVTVAMSNSFGFGGHNATLLATEFNR
ncbi:3-oxoacyl-[acyl-carrier-protein] synthase II [Terrimicrobium sacchariphilum]|uniref:3-oxoacyl-[acyl-carrier-protein] synthase 2 n=1 Tax=Terrimicrobium sacchariphilum TaxID=690879 RepID=A0A146GDB1_TERSA|nr:beta-ketoacyl-ACP synthase II [Terrimicrobium sacchariphilum]GAT34724.1 3-oxoacyl-[acyl-carrier-protein] synthase II [Terrimicrobium sacchariphilum]